MATGQFPKRCETEEQEQERRNKIRDRQLEMDYDEKEYYKREYVPKSEREGDKHFA